MTSSCIFGSVRLKIAENPNFFVFNPICLKFGIGGNFEMLITKSNLKLRLENDLSRKMQFSTDFRQNFTNSVTMATVDVPWDWFVFRIQAYQYIVKVRKFQLPTAYCFSTAEGRTSLWGIPPPPACLGLNTVASVVAGFTYSYVFLRLSG